MMTKETFSSTLLEEQDKLAIKKFIYKIFRKWYWFVAACIIGAGTGYFLTQTKSPTYQLNSLFLIESDNMAEMTLDLPFAGGRQGNTKLQNKIGIITSYQINKQVLENLDWSISWFEELMFRESEIYPQKPFDVRYDRQSVNLTGIPIYIKMIDSTSYQITVNANKNIAGREVEIDFTKRASFGEPFSNTYFNFTLYPEFAGSGDEFFFVFNNFDSQLENYMGRLSVGEVDPEMKADLVGLSMLDRVPQKAADYLNELSRVYINHELREKNHKSTTTINFIDSQLKDVVDTLKVAGNNFTSFRSKNQIVNLNQEGGIIMNQLVDLDTEKSTIQSHLDYYRNLKEYLNDKDKMKEVVAPSVVGIVDESLNNLVVRLSDLYRNREVISYTAQEKNPKLILIQNEIEMVKRNLQENLRNLINNAIVQIQGIDRRIEKVNRQLAKYPKTEQEMINMKRMLDLNDELYTFLLKKRAEAAITHASNVADTKVLDSADPKLARYMGPYLIKNVAIGILAGLMIPFMIIVVASYYYDRIRSADDIEGYSDIPVIGNIVLSTATAGSEFLTAVDNPRSAIAETYRELRTNLQFIRSKDNNKNTVIGVNSVIPGEGKSFTAANLSSMIAINNKKVLLIDCDMRKPSLHARLKYKNKEGLSTFLTAFSSFDDILRQTRVDNLYFISAGPIPPNPSELLENGKFDELIERAKERFDYIVFDNPPISLVSDGIIIGQKVDINLFVTRQDYSKKSEIKFIDHVHKKKSMNNAGIILNGINLSKHAHAGSYGADYSFKKKSGNYYFNSSPSHAG